MLHHRLQPMRLGHPVCLSWPAGSLRANFNSNNDRVQLDPRSRFVDEGEISQFRLCRLANGTSCEGVLLLAASLGVCAEPAAALLAASLHSVGGGVLVMRETVGAVTVVHTFWVSFR